MSRGYPLTEPERKKIVELYKDGYEIASIAERFDVSRFGVRNALIAEGVPRTRNSISMSRNKGKFDPF